LVTVSVTGGGCRAKVAVTAVTVESDTEQVPAPEQPPPLHPVNTEPGAGPAERVTLVPKGKLPVQVPPQLIPAGELETVPVPAPALLIVSATVCTVNGRDRGRGAEKVTEQVPVPTAAAPPEKVDPAVALAVRAIKCRGIGVRAVPAANDSSRHAGDRPAAVAHLEHREPNI
jgi:hypothetical protein